MKFTDAKAIELLNKLCSYDVECSIETYPEDEREGRSDMQVLADEASYYLSLYHEDGTTFREELLEAKNKLKRTDYGKRIPCGRDWQPQHGYWPSDIQSAKNLVNEVARLERFAKKMEKLGYVGMWA